MSKEEGIHQVYGGGGHVVILGAGASIASTLRNPEVRSKKLPSMDNFIKVVGLQEIIKDVPLHLLSGNFEALYTNLHNDNPLSLELSAASLRIFKWNGVYDSNKIYFISAASLKTLSYSMSGETLCLTLRTDDEFLRGVRL